MTATKETAAAMPSSTSFTDSTACTVPRSSPSLSSAVRPFYPRAYQQLFHPHSEFVGSHDGDFQSPFHLPDDVSASQSHFSLWSHVNDAKFYDQQYFASMLAEPYEPLWVPNDETTWNSAVSCDPTGYTYADDGALDSAIFDSDSIIYHAESQNLAQDKSACASSNNISETSHDKSTQLLSCHVNDIPKADFSNSIAEGAAVPNLFNRVIQPEQSRGVLNKVTESSLLNSMESKEKEMSGYGHALASDKIKGVANTSLGSKLDLNKSASLVTIQSTSGFGTHSRELKSTTDLVEHVQAQKESKSLKTASHNFNNEHGSTDAINKKHFVPLTLDSLECADKFNLKSSTISLVTGSCEKAESNKSMSHHNDMRPCNDAYKTMASPKPVLSKMLGQMNEFEELGQGGFQHNDVGLCSKGPLVLVECIHNLSKVLLYSQSKDSLIALDFSDWLRLENAICMLSHRLLQFSAIGSNSYQDSNPQLHDAERAANISNDCKNAFVEPAFLQKSSKQISNLKQVLDSTSNLQHEKELRVLIGDMQKLREEIDYERSESNATVSLYKSLWIEAQDALKVSRAEVQEIRRELAAVKQELTNLNLSGSVMMNNDYGTVIKQDMNKDSVKTPLHSVTRSELPGVLNGNIENTCCGRSQEGLKAWSGYFDAGSLANHSTSCTPFVKLGVNAKHSDLAANSSGVISKGRTKRSLNHMFAPPASLENDVAQRLSLLLSRKGVDLNKSCIDDVVEGRLGSEMIVKSSSKSLGECEMTLPNEKYLYLSETSCPVNGYDGFGACHETPGFRAADSPSDLTERQCNDASIDANEPVTICEEDDVEDICFKPGSTDGNFTYLTQGPEWEDVFVAAVNDHGQKKGATD